MRPIHLARLDKTRPVLVLTREAVRPYMMRVTIAPITSRIRGLATEVRLSPERNGVDQHCVVSCDNIVTVAATALGRAIGRLVPEQERELAEAIATAFDLADL
jgi:mRNA interferase MazF